MKTMLEHLRETAHLTQRDLARLAGITQETLSQLETGKSTRPRLDTLTKLCEALELGSMRPSDLLNPSPLDADPELGKAEVQLISLLKVLPHYDYTLRVRADVFWDLFCQQIGYRDHYPAAKIAGWLESASAGNSKSATTNLAEYTLMFFDPDNEKTLQLLADRGRVGPGVPVARRWCRDVTDAAWILHRAVMTSYPQQVGQLYVEAGETDNPERIAELRHSVYEEIRGRAFAHSPADEQIRALREDPSDNVLYEVASVGEQPVQEVAVTIPRAWPGLARNPELDPAIADQFVTSVLAELRGPNKRHASSALLDLTDRPDLPRPLLERIKDAIDRGAVDGDDDYRAEVLSSVLNVRGTLSQLDAESEKAEQAASARRERLHVVEHQQDDKPAWWRRFTR
ncbi:helix-turn-helix transcriptional regulator [Saccharopolyspora pogona]|uniref:helix-turn-helix transcriptional regulator n=1 Tax=Saccharopolyspora pogona TaxID=333966 RepID=UPI0016851BC3|nr:helix-turn-helix transcriptional regulator [Saccharopolyspora pogona]